MDNNKKLKLRITALTLASTLILNGCGVNNKFKITENENNELVGMDDSYIDSKFINNYYVVEVYNNIRKQNEIYIASKKHLRYNGNKYYDVFTNLELVCDNTNNDSILEYVKATNLSEYIISFDMGQAQYSYDDMKNIYEIIKENYIFSDNSSLKKRILDYKI